MDRPEMQAHAIWAQILTKVQEEVLSEAACNKWLRPAHPINLTDQMLTIGTDNEFTKRWIESRYINLLEETILSITGKKIRIVFKNLNLPSD